MLTHDLVRYNARLAHALLADKGAIACAEAALPIYPFPKHTHKMWDEPAGQMLLRCGEMTPASMHASPQAAAVYVFPPSWRSKACTLAKQRLVSANTVTEAVDKLLLLFMSELNCSKAHARMRLAASHVCTVDATYWQSSSPVTAYATFTDKGCYLHVSGADTDSPELVEFASMQDDLNCEEQLNFIVMTNHFNYVYQRIAYNQPLPLQCDWQNTETCLRFCDKCCVNWNTNWDGVYSDILYCPHENCEFMVHECCTGAQQTCPHHAGRKLQRVSTQNNVDTSIVACSGMVSVRGAWCFVLAQWPAAERCISAVGLLHPIALATVVDDADKRIASGQWFAVTIGADMAVTDGAGAKRKDCDTACDKKLSDALAELECLSHLQQTDREPDYWLPACKPPHKHTVCADTDVHLAQRAPGVCYPDAKGLGQLPTQARCASRLSATIERILSSIQVYHEPEFGRMCRRFRASGADVDQVLRKWILLRMPLLPGDVQASATMAASCMHVAALNAIISPKTRERARQMTYEPRHWCVTQIDAVLPASREADYGFMQQLGLSGTLTVPAELGPVATPSAAGPVTRPPLKDYGLFAVRVLMNPSARVALVHLILKHAAEKYQLGGTFDTLLAREIAPILGQPSASDITAFRSACLESSLYGQVYLWLLQHGGNYTSACDSDTTGKLASAACKSDKEWSGNWQPVEDLRGCTDSAYASFGCGSMAHWQTVLMHGRRSFLFEQHLGSLHAIAKSPICGNMIHIVPCAWADLDLDCMGERSIVATVHKSAAAVPKTCFRTNVHYLSPDFGEHQWANSEWKHSQRHCEPFQRTLYAYDTYMAMQS